MPYHSSYDLKEELEEVADSLVQDLKNKENFKERKYEL